MSVPGAAPASRATPGGATRALRELPRHVLGGLLLATLIFGLSLTAALQAPVPGSAASPGGAILFAAYALVLALAFRVARRSRPLPVGAFLAGYALLFVCLDALYLGLVRPELRSDFADMWRFARQFAAADAIPTPVGYEAQRALPVLTPLAIVFGDSPWVYKIANLLMLLASSLVFYDLVRRWFGHAVGQAQLVLLPLASEPYFASATSSHDVSGLFFLVGGFWLTAFLHRAASRPHWPSLCAGSAALGGVLTLLHVQRGVSTFFLLAVLAVLLAEWWASGFAGPRQALTRIAFAAVAPFLLSTAVGSALSAQGRLLPAAFHEEFVAKSFANFSGSFSPGTYVSHVRFRQKFLDPLEVEEVVELGRHMFLSDLYYDAPRYRPGNYRARAERLFSLGSQGRYYYGTTAPDSPLTGARVGPALDAFNAVAVHVYCLVGAVALAWVVYVVRPDWIALLPLTYLGGLVAGLLLVGENQPRYLFPIWLVLASVVALAFSRWRWAALREVGPSALALRVAAGPALLSALAACGWLWLRATYDVSDGRIIGEWDRVESNLALPDETLGLVFDASQLGPRRGVAGRAFGSLVTSLRFPEAPRAGEWVQVRRLVCGLDPERRALGLFLYWGGAVRELEDGFRFSVLADGEAVYDRSIGRARTVSGVRLDDVFGASRCVNLALRVTANRDVEGPRWQTVSSAHVYFPRLVP